MAQNELSQKPGGLNSLKKGEYQVVPVTSAKLVNAPVFMPSSFLQRIRCRLGFHDYSGGILPGLFEMRFEGVLGTWWPISSSFFGGGYCIYCGDCLPNVIVIPSKDNPPHLQIAGSVGEVLKKIRDVERCRK